MPAGANLACCDQPLGTILILLPIQCCLFFLAPFCAQGKPLNRTRMVIKVAGTAAGYYAVMLYRAVAAAAAATRLPPAASIHTLRSQESVWTFLPRWMQCPEVVTVACMLLCHGLGALVYATHWPQCYYPRVFDLCVSEQAGMRQICKCRELVFAAGR